MQTKTVGCQADGLLPDRACTLGAIETTDARVVCGTGTKARRHVTEAERRSVFGMYGLSPHQAPGAYEVDHLVPLELGGSNDVANLWPESAPGFHAKDAVENVLHARVCSGAMSLEEAQSKIAADWTTAAAR